MPDTPAPMRALGAVIRDPEAPAAIADDDAAYLARSGVEGEDATALASRGTPRLLAYRALVHNRIRNVIDDWIPRSASRLGAERFGADVASFIAEFGPRSPYLREVPAEFVEWVAPRWAKDPRLAPYLLELARYELLRHDVRNDPRGGEIDSGEKLELDWPIRCNSTGRVLTFDWAVHELPKDRDDRTDPAPGPVHLAIFRNRNEAMMYKVLDRYEAALVRRILAAETMREAIFGACSDAEVEISDERLAQVATLLARLAELGLVLGGEPPAASSL